MNDSASLSISSPKKPAFWLLSLGVLCLSIIVATLLEAHIVFPLAFTLAFISFLFVRKPLHLLGVLLVARMSLDHLSENIRFDVGNQFSLSLSQTLGAFLVLISIFLFWIHAKKFPKFPLRKAFFILLGMEVAFSFWSIAPLSSIQEIARVISIFSISFLAFISITDPKDIRKVLFLILLSGIIPIIEATRQVILGTGISDNVVDTARIYGTFAHPNVLALFLYSLCVILGLHFLLAKKTFPENLSAETIKLLFFLMPLIVLLILTYTRIAWIILFLFAFALALWRYRILLFPLILVPVFLIIAIPSVQNRIFESFQTSADSSIVWRQEIWHDVTAKLRMDGKQYIGTGPDTFSLYAENLRGIRFGSTDSHNDFVKFFVEGGWVGLALFGLYLGFIGREIRTFFSLPEPYRDLAVVFAFFAGTLLIASLSDNIYENTPLQWIFFILLGALLGLKHTLALSKAQQEQANQSQSK